MPLTGDFYENLLPIYALSTAVGVFPMLPLKISDKYVLHTSKKLHLTTVSLLAMYSWCFIVTLIKRSNNVVGQKFYSRRNNVSNFGLAFQFSVSFVLLYVVYFTSFFLTDRVKQVMVSLHKIDATLKKMGQKFEYKATFYYQMFIIGSGLGVICLNASLQIQNIKTENFSYISAHMWVLLLYPMVVLYDLNSHLGITAVLIYQRFKMIGQQLEDISNQKNEKSAHVVRKIVELAKLHDVLCKAANTTNRNFNVQLIPTLAQQYFNSLYSIFYYYWMSSTKPFSAGCWMAWGILKIYEMLHVTIACHLASDEAQVVGRQVHKLLIKTRNEQVEEKLLMFSKQIRHGRFEFTLCGLFTIDAGLIFNMIGSSTTFIVIMIQFQETMSPPVCF